MRKSFKPEELQPTIIPGQIICSGTAVWHYNKINNDYTVQSEKLKRNMGQFSPTTTLETEAAATTFVVNSNNANKIIKFSKHIIDYPCSNLINEHLMNGQFYRDIGSYTLNTEWLV